MRSREKNVRVAGPLSDTTRNLATHFLSERSDFINDEFLHAFDGILFFEAEVKFLFVSDQ